MWINKGQLHRCLLLLVFSIPFTHIFISGGKHHRHAFFEICINVNVKSLKILNLHSVNLYFQSWNSSECFTGEISVSVFLSAFITVLK